MTLWAGCSSKSPSIRCGRRASSEGIAAPANPIRNEPASILAILMPTELMCSLSFGIKGLAWLGLEGATESFSPGPRVSSEGSGLHPLRRRP